MNPRTNPFRHNVCFFPDNNTGFGALRPFDEGLPATGKRTLVSSP